MLLLTYLWLAKCKIEKEEVRYSREEIDAALTNKNTCLFILAIRKPALKVATVVADLCSFCACFYTFIWFIHSVCFTFLNSCTMSIEQVHICCFQLVLFLIIVTLSFLHHVLVNIDIVEIINHQFLTIKGYLPAG